MFGKFSAVFITLLVLEENVSGNKYNREYLQKKYPGFGKDWLPMGKDENGYIIGYLTEPKGRGFTNIESDLKDMVVFTLFTRSNIETGTKITSSFDIVDKILQKDKPTKFIIHGWLARGTNPDPVEIKDGFLKKYDANVFIVDWHEISKNFVYPAVLPYIVPVGKYVATFIDHITNLGVDTKNIHLVGHSLGAHVSGAAARNIKQSKLARITGLDPAKPGFDLGHLSTAKLEKNDAHFVDVIHTCAGYLGHPDPLGHADFYPNGGGPPQPNCELSAELMEACSHGESWKFFEQSLESSVKFKARRCNSWEEYKNNYKTCDNRIVPMGDPVPATTRGIYYLRTDASSGHSGDKKFVTNG